MQTANETAHGTYGTYGTYGESTNVKRALMAKPKDRDHAAARGQNGSQETEWEGVDGFIWLRTVMTGRFF
jgi:hypothetical protein